MKQLAVFVLLPRETYDTYEGHEEYATIDKNICFVGRSQVLTRLLIQPCL